MAMVYSDGRHECREYNGHMHYCQGTKLVIAIRLFVDMYCYHGDGRSSSYHCCVYHQQLYVGKCLRLFVVVDEHVMLPWQW